MKKLFSVVLALMLVFCVAGCGDSDKSSKAEISKGENSKAEEISAAESLAADVMGS